MITDTSAMPASSAAESSTADITLSTITGRVSSSETSRP